jgi:hypothetical protein
MHQCTNAVRSRRFVVREQCNHVRTASGLRSNTHKCAGTAHKTYISLFTLMPKCPWDEDVQRHAANAYIKYRRMLLAIVSHQYSQG